MGGALHLNKVKYPSPKDALCQVWLKLALWFWRRKILNFVKIFSFLSYYLPLKKGMVPHLKKLESRLSKNGFVSSFIKIVRWFWRRRRKCEKFMTTTTTKQRTTDKLWSEKLTWAFSTGELTTPGTKWAKRFH